MPSFREQKGVLGPIYRLASEGLNDEGIALQLGLTEVKVRGCIGWIVYFLELKSRQELVLHKRNHQPRQCRNRNGQSEREQSPLH
jgi:hypothetical protein